MKVRATRTGYYGHQRRRAGEVFSVKGEHEIIDPVTKAKKKVTDFSKDWMEEVDDGQDVTRKHLRDERQDANSDVEEPVEDKPTEEPIEAEQPHGRRRKHKEVI